ncbi:MAG: 30S ribosomal protein S9 [Patescibacteria group bacterium]
MPTKDIATHETKKASSFERAVGRRKTASARVRITPGTGQCTVNDKPLAVYFPLPLWQELVRAPFRVIGREDGFDVTTKVSGGGVRAQAEAIRHGIARALVEWNPDLRKLLRAERLLTRDSRMKERKKFGRHRARRGHQWRKR